jgi:hypothetical protein
MWVVLLKIDVGEKPFPIKRRAFFLNCGCSEKMASGYG